MQHNNILEGKKTIDPKKKNLYTLDKLRIIKTYPSYFVDLLDWDKAAFTFLNEQLIVRRYNMTPTHSSLPRSSPAASCPLSTVNFMTHTRGSSAIKLTCS